MASKDADSRTALGQIPGLIVNMPSGGRFEELPLPESIAMACRLVEKMTDRQRTPAEESLYKAALRCLAAFLLHAPIMCIQYPKGEIFVD